jgi:hypothetical protein
MLSEEYKIQLFKKNGDNYIYSRREKYCGDRRNWSISKVLSHLSYSSKRRAFFNNI